MPVGGCTLKNQEERKKGSDEKKTFEPRKKFR